MDFTISEVLSFVRENDVKFIKLAFCDIFGTQKNISIMPNELERAFTKGISFDASSVRGFMNTNSDLCLVPDASTLSILPWRPTQGRVIRFFCDIKNSDGTTFEGDGRNILKCAIDRAFKMGYTCKFGAESEFYLFKMDENQMPTKIPFDFASYCDISPLDKGENVRREICLTLEEMGIIPESSHHEEGPGQNEIVFKYSDALQTADNLVTFKSVVKVIAERNGLYASFMPKPFAHKSGSGLHIDLSLYKNNKNIFQKTENGYSDDAKNCIAGIMQHIKEMTAFLNPLTNSYQRFGSFEAPRNITWSDKNCSQLIRIPPATGDNARMELRSPDSSCNPYMAFALIIHAALDGIENNVCLDNYPETTQSEALENIEKLPNNLAQAIMIAGESEFVSKIIPEKTLNKYIEEKTIEYSRYSSAFNKAEEEDEMYFRTV